MFSLSIVHNPMPSGCIPATCFIQLEGPGEAGAKMKRTKTSYFLTVMASKKVLRDGWSEILKKDNYAKGVVVRTTDKGIEIDLYIIVSFGVKISEVVQEAQKKVKYVLEKSLNIELSAVNVFVQGVRVIG